MRSAIQSALVFLFAALATTSSLALTINVQITPAYLRENPNQFIVKVSKGKNGLIDFKVTRLLSDPMYLVAHLA